MRKVLFHALILILSVVQPGWAGEDGAAEGDPANGKALFESDLGCHVCHGVRTRQGLLAQISGRRLPLSWSTTPCRIFRT